MLLRLLRHDATSGFMADSDRICLGRSRHGTVRCRNSAGRAAPASFVLSYRFVRGHPCRRLQSSCRLHYANTADTDRQQWHAPVRLIGFAAAPLRHDGGWNVEYGLARPQAATTVPYASLSNDNRSMTRGIDDTDRQRQVMPMLTAIGQILPIVDVGCRLLQALLKRLLVNADLVMQQQDVLIKLPSSERSLLFTCCWTATNQKNWTIAATFFWCELLRWPNKSRHRRVVIVSMNHTSEERNREFAHDSYPRLKIGSRPGHFSNGNAKQANDGPMVKR
jgi:hypothetical protein